MATVQFQVQGMSCTGCAKSVERRLLTTPGVVAASVDLTTTLAFINFDDTLTTSESLGKVIETLGFTVVHSGV